MTGFHADFSKPEETHMPIQEAIRFEVRDHIARLTLNGHEKKNAINHAMRKEVREAYFDVKKEAARRGQDMPFYDRIYMARDIANRVLHTNDAKEGILAFREKRPPVWRRR
jgi:enoyl-CoA hydratase/carnithine racemase